MTEVEFAQLSREMRIRKVAIAKGEIDLRIVEADRNRIQMALATDRAYVANGQALIDQHWQHTFATEAVAS